MQLISIEQEFVLIWMLAVSLLLHTWPPFIKGSENTVKYLLDEIEQGRFWNTIRGQDEASGPWEAFLENEGRPIVEQFYK